MNKRILIVDDDPVIHESISIYLKKESFEVSSAFNGQEALQKFQNDKPNLIILDMMMPVLGGNEVCKIIRQTSNVPIIMLTAKSEEIDKILSLELGADDYLTKPFSIRELVARINSVLRRTNAELHHSMLNPLLGNELFHTPIFRIDEDNLSVELYNEAIALTIKEYEILKFLVKNKDQIVSREKILKSVWGNDYNGDVRMIDAHIKKIRQKIYVNNHKWFINSIYRVGYKFEYQN